MMPHTTQGRFLPLSYPGSLSLLSCSQFMKARILIPILLVSLAINVAGVATHSTVLWVVSVIGFISYYVAKKSL